MPPPEYSHERATHPFPPAFTCLRNGAGIGEHGSGTRTPSNRCRRNRQRFLKSSKPWVTLHRGEQLRRFNWGPVCFASLELSREKIA